MAVMSWNIIEEINSEENVKEVFIVVETWDKEDLSSGGGSGIQKME